MSRTALLGSFVFVVAGLSGCASPVKVVQNDNNNSVVLAIPDNTDNWPYHHRTEAAKVAADILQDPAPMLVKTERVKVGETITNIQDTTKRDIGGSENKPKIGEVTTSRNTTSTSDNYEYHLVFQRRDMNKVPDSLLRTRTPTPPTPNGPPLNTAGSLNPQGSAITPAGGPTGPNLSPPPAGDITMPPLNPPSSPPTTLPTMRITSPGQGQ